MANSSRPQFIDLGDLRQFNPEEPQRLQPSPGNLPSPRAGDVAPALSPLDAFAFQSRILAAKFHENDGRRISRLPPLTIADGLARSRQAYANSRPPPPTSTSVEQGSQDTNKPEPSGISPEYAQPDSKHRSYYPSIQSFDDTSSIYSTDQYATAQPTLQPVSEETYDEYSSGHSPSPDMHSASSDYQPSTSKIDFAPGLPQRQRTNDSTKSNWSNTLAPPPHQSPALRPRSPRPQQTIRHVRKDSGDSDVLSFHSDPYDLRSYDRRPSTSNVRDRPRSPFSPQLNGRRSPSISSEISNNEITLPRRSMNFSRPLSPANRFHRPSTVDSRPSFETSTRILQADGTERPSMDALSISDSIVALPEPSPAFSEDPNNVMTDDEIAPMHQSDGNGPASYIYTKYSLPRGRKVVSRTSLAAQDWLASKFNWDEAQADEAATATKEPAKDVAKETSPKVVPKNQVTDKPKEDHPGDTRAVSRDGRRAPKFTENFDTDLSPAPKLPLEPKAQRPQEIKAQAQPSHTPFASPNGNHQGHKPKSRTRSRSHDGALGLPDLHGPRSQKSNPSLSKSASNTPTDAQFPVSNTTLQPSGVNHNQAKNDERPKGKDRHSHNPDQLSAEEHLAKGIELHEDGELQKSTYHLRIAAKSGSPTAMLLYALACRHGWGMRSNQHEGVWWLKKAMDSAKLEVEGDETLLPPTMADGEANTPESGVKAAQARRTHRAQLALAIYELGVSYMNGWGVGQDRALALRCFETAGNWGDGDALAEAGFCYAKGVGCKKDLYKAAGYYRRAEEKGIGGAGNSWIYKDKYMPKEGDGDDRKGRGRKDDKKDEKKDKKPPREKSRQRTKSIWGGRKKDPALPS